MGAAGDVRAIRARSMDRMRSEQDPDRAVAFALSGLWDAVEVLTQALEAADPRDECALADLERLVRSLPTRLANVDGDACATIEVAERLAAAVADVGRRRRLVL